MKKIDLHLHTIATSSDAPFEFSLPKLQAYVVEMEIDCIAVTNHNLFSLEQYRQIADGLPILILPGIEIDLEGGHLLLIGDPERVERFADSCTAVSDLFTSECKDITVTQLQQAFGDLSAYLLIPHYDKKPIVQEATLTKLNPHVQAGEVTSVKKFISCSKDAEKLVPVLFSDIRFSTSMGPFPVRQTWVTLEDVSFRGIKACLSDRTKVCLSKEDGNELFPATDDSLMLSTGLNVILGERSSGKTHTLKRIFQTIGHIKYIEQFSLLQNDTAKFDELTTVRQSSISESFLKEFKEVVDDVSKVNLEQNNLDLETYIANLLKFASESGLQDAYSKAALFGETPFTESNVKGLTNLIEAIGIIIDNAENRDIIEKHVSLNGLKSLAVELILKLRNTKRLNAKIKWLNALLKDIQSDLQMKSASTHPTDVDFYRTILEDKKVEKFSEIVGHIKVPRRIDSKDVKGFRIVATTGPFQNATHMKRKHNAKVSLVPAYNNYNSPYQFLKCLKEIESLPQTDYHKLFVDIDYKTLNKHGFEVSGGERSEFNLLHEISDALQYDALLIDEPESSFDNLFLKNEVNEHLKDIAKIIPVIIVTHNSTVGASIKPDRIIYTQKQVTAVGINYKIFCGNPSDKKLTSNTGESINNLQILMDCLEAGESAYRDRKQNSYEILKD